MAQGFKTGGRKKGTQNKVTGSVKEMISLSVRKELESLPTLLKKLEPKERMDVIIKLIAYIVPKANSENDDPLFKQQDKNDFFSDLYLKMSNQAPEKSQY